MYTSASYSIGCIDYDHASNLHTVAGARTALQNFFGSSSPTSLLDVGCGTGTWLRAAFDLGVPEIYGIDGVPMNRDALLIPPEFFHPVDLQRRIDLGRKFDMALCLEVAEHLPADVAPQLIATLASHSNLVLFSAAAPGQR